MSRRRPPLWNLFHTGLFLLSGCQGEHAHPSTVPTSTVSLKKAASPAKKGVRQRCKIDPEWEADQVEDLKKYFGDDWERARDAIRTLWEELLRIAETGDRQAFANLLTYPIEFFLHHQDSTTLWEAWTLHSQEEAKKVFPYVFNELTKKNFLEEPNCIANLVGDYLFFFSGRFSFSVKKLRNGLKSNPSYTITLYRLHIDSPDFSNDIGKTRYELKHKGTRDHSRPPP